MLHFLILLTFVFQFSVSHADLIEGLDKNSATQFEQEAVDFDLGKKLLDRLQRTTYSIHLDVLDYSSENGLNLELSAPYKIKPSYLDDYYTRVEKYVFGADVDLEKTLDFLDKFMSLGAGGRVELEFARQFDKFEDAWNVSKYPPYGPKRIPFNTKAALEGLKELDFFGMKANLAVDFTPIRGSYSHAALNASLSGSWIYKGELLVHVFRLSQNRVRVKLIAVKTKGPEGKAELKVQPTVTSFGWDPLNNLFEKIGSLVLFEGTQTGASQINLPDMKDRLLMADYIFDLNNPDAINAYDELFSRFYVIKDKKLNIELIKEGADVLNPFEQDLNDGKKYLKMHLGKIEEIYNQDKHLAQNCPNGLPPTGMNVLCPRISRYIAVQNDSLSNATSYKWGASPIFSREGRSRYSDNRITQRDDQNNLKYFKHLLYEGSKKNKGWFGTFNNATIKSLDVLCALNFENDEDCQFQGLGVHLELTDTDYNAEDHAAFLKYMESSLPKAVFNKIPLADWAQIKDRKNASVVLRFLFKKDAINLLGGFGGPKPDIQGLLTEYVKQKEPLTVENLYNSYPQGESSEPPFLTRQEDPVTKYEKDIKFVSSKLLIAFDETKVDNERIAAIMDLKGNEFFEKFGTGFVISLLSKDALHELLYVRLNMTAKGEKHFEWKYGESDKIKIYRSFLYMQSIMYDRDIDPRIQTELSEEVKSSKSLEQKPD
ncbi:MAG: hypothetical protein IPM57_12230 [Oligoflexia bacterium]|nr:hypothetical protein [Oligoflexia bacterium]